MAAAAIRTKHLAGEMGVSRQEKALDRLLVDQESGRTLEREERGVGWNFP